MVKTSIVEGSLEVKLPTIWTDGKTEVGRVSEEKESVEITSEKRKSQKKDAGGRKGRKVANHSVFPMFCGSGGSKSRLAKGCGAIWADERWTIARRCGAKHVSASKRQKNHFGGWDVENVHAVLAPSELRSQNVQNTRGSDHFWTLNCATLHHTTATATATPTTTTTTTTRTTTTATATTSTTTATTATRTTATTATTITTTTAITTATTTTTLRYSYRYSYSYNSNSNSTRRYTMLHDTTTTTTTATNCNCSYNYNSTTLLSPLSTSPHYHYTKLQLQLQLYIGTTLHHTTSSSCGGGGHCNHSKKTRREPTFGPSLTLPPPPCAVLLEYSISDTISLLKPPNRFSSPS